MVVVVIQAKLARTALDDRWDFVVERVKGIEPSLSAWESERCDGP